MMTTKSLLVMTFAAFALAGCGEKPQGIGGAKSDVAPFSGTENNKYAQQGWKAGDKASWEQQLKTRAQNQNDYSRAN
jgi:starvation-inducible outer membrane lipoprotein